MPSWPSGFLPFDRNRCFFFFLMRLRTMTALSSTQNWSLYIGYSAQDTEKIFCSLFYQKSSPPWSEMPPVNWCLFAYCFGSSYALPTVCSLFTKKWNSNCRLYLSAEYSCGGIVLCKVQRMLPHDTNNINHEEAYWVNFQLVYVVVNTTKINPSR